MGFSFENIIYLFERLGTFYLFNVIRRYPLDGGLPAFDGDESNREFGSHALVNGAVHIDIVGDIIV
jgi:hypothetical protein